MVLGSKLTLDQPEAVAKVRNAEGQVAGSNRFQLSNIVMLYDICYLQSELQEKYFSQLASGGTLIYETHFLAQRGISSE